MTDGQLNNEINRINMYILELTRLNREYYKSLDFRLSIHRKAITSVLFMNLASWIVQIAFYFQS